MASGTVEIINRLKDEQLPPRRIASSGSLFAKSKDRNWLGTGERSRRAPNKRRRPTRSHARRSPKRQMAKLVFPISDFLWLATWQQE